MIFGARWAWPFGGGDAGLRGVADEFERRGGDRVSCRGVLVPESIRRGEGEAWPDVTIIWRGRVLFERRGGMTRYLAPSAPYEIWGSLPVGIFTPGGSTETVSARRGTVGREVE